MSANQPTEMSKDAMKAKYVLRAAENGIRRYLAALKPPLAVRKPTIKRMR